MPALLTVIKTLFVDSPKDSIPALLRLDPWKTIRSLAAQDPDNAGQLADHLDIMGPCVDSLTEAAVEEKAFKGPSVASFTEAAVVKKRLSWVPLMPPSQRQQLRKRLSWVLCCLPSQSQLLRKRLSWALCCLPHRGSS